MFDLTVHKRNTKGHISKVNPYRLIIENGVKKFEQPPNSGIFYAENGELLTKPAAAAPQEAKKTEQIVEQLAQEILPDTKETPKATLKK